MSSTCCLAAEVESEMYHVATPLLSSFGYRQARVTNSQAVELLTGPASVFLDDRFVGQMEVPSTASSQKLTIGFGVDPQIRKRRELVAKTYNVKGGNRLISFEYKPVISNFKGEPVTARLLDRVPVTTEAGELSVTLGSMPQALSEDGLYLRTLRPLGMLRWDMSVPEKRIGADAMDVLYSCTLEFDRNRMPSTQHSLDDILADYDESAGRGVADLVAGEAVVFFCGRPERLPDATECLWVPTGATLRNASATSRQRIAHARVETVARRRRRNHAKLPG